MVSLLLFVVLLCLVFCQSGTMMKVTDYSTGYIELLWNSYVEFACFTDTITALFKTNFRIDFPFDTEEFIAFSLIG